MKLFNKQNTVNTKFIYQTFPFANCQTSGNSVLSTPSSNVITNHYNRSILSTEGFGAASSSSGYLVGGRIYYFNTIMTEEEVYGVVPGSTNTSYLVGWGGSLAGTIGTAPAASFITSSSSPQQTSGWMTKSPIKNGLTITGFRLSNVQNTGGGGITLTAHIFEYDNTTDTLTTITTISLTTLLGGPIIRYTPVVNLPFSFTGNGDKHIGFAIVSSNTGAPQGISRAINILF